MGGTDDDAVTVWALLGVVIHSLKDEGLLTGVPALKEYYDLSVLEEFHLRKVSATALQHRTAHHCRIFGYRSFAGQSVDNCHA